MPRSMKVREIVRLIEDDGWYLVRTKGSHRQFKHDTKSGLVTIAGKPSQTLHPKTVNSILLQAGLKNMDTMSESEDEDVSGEE